MEICIIDNFGSHIDQERKYIKRGFPSYIALEAYLMRYYKGYVIKKVEVGEFQYFVIKDPAFTGFSLAGPLPYIMTLEHNIDIIATRLILNPPDSILRSDFNIQALLTG